MKLDKALDTVEDMTIVVMIVGFIAQTYGYVLDVIGMGDRTTKSIALVGVIVIICALIVNLLVGWAHSLRRKGTT